MNIYKIKYFLDLVECRNFTDAAKKNYVSQTTVSQQIASLEKEYGMQLIDRKKVPIEPTQAGWVFHKEALALWKQYERLNEKMENFMKDHNQSLHIEYAGVMDVSCLFPFIPKFKDEHSNIDIEIKKVRLGNVSDYLHKGIYDIAVAFDSEFTANDDVKTFPIVEGNYAAMVSKNHPLYDKKQIQKEELYQYPLIMLDPSILGTSYDLMLEHAREDGFSPNIVRTADDVESELFYIATENLIGFFPDQYKTGDNFKDFKLIPIEGSSHKYKIVVATLKNTSNPSVKLFFDVLNEDIKKIYNEDNKKI